MVHKFCKESLLQGSLFSAIIILMISSISVGAMAQPSTPNVISTRDHFDKSGNVLVSDRPYDPFDFASFGCPKETVIYVHGVWTAKDRDDEVAESMFENALEISDRARLSLESLDYTFPVIGFSWDSDTEISQDGWRDAKLIAKENGPKLAQFVIDLKEKCPQTAVRIIAHSLGARVVLSSLDSLTNNEIWNSNKFQIASVHLLGAAVDDDEISKEASDVISTDGIKSAYGKAIEDEVSEFYNLVNPQDDALEPGPVNPLICINPYCIWNPFEFQPVYYPYNEQDLAVGQKGIEASILDSNRPENYSDITIQEGEIPTALIDADADGTCDFGFFGPSGFVCTIHNEGDNHLGYIGFRGPMPNSLIENGVMDTVVETIQNPP